MPESEAVYQPTTVGYSYDAGGDGNDPGNGIRNGFSRIIFRHKVSTRKWAEWVLLSVALCASVAGLATLLVNLMAVNDVSATSGDSSRERSKDSGKDAGVEETTDRGSGGSVAVGATIMLAGLLMGCAWAWLRFFRRGKSPRGGTARGSGQYGPVLTEVPSQMLPTKMANPHDTRVAIPLSDQEEETRTLMPETTGPTATTAVTTTLPVSGSDNAAGEAPNTQIVG